MLFFWHNNIFVLSLLWTERIIPPIYRWYNRF